MSDLMLDVDQAGELKAAFRRGDWTNAEIKRLSEGDVLSQVRRVIQGSAVIVVKKEEFLLDTIVRVNRSVRPAYPDWVDKVMNPELESTGPAEYDLATSIALWLHEGQQGGVVTGQVIYAYLNEHDLLRSCLSLQDALEIQKNGVAVFQKVFGDKIVYFWKSVVQNRDDRNLHVPCLYVHGDRVVLHWDWLGHDWDDGEPAVRFAS
ncbi:MAG: hypothetical protein HY420_03145 [Candidatus Kerfeldbacteria bacterium]|nr:hypothetical protein [Candidatus Kerfeldbacteria bacterium]